MDNNKLKIGTRVKLKSNGPEMTVVSVSEEKNTVFCKWAELNANHKWIWGTDNFPIDALKNLDDKSN